MIENDESNSLIKNDISNLDTSQLGNTIISNVPPHEPLQTQRSVEKEEKNQISEESKYYFKNILTSFFLVTTIQIIIPQVVIIITKKTLDYHSFFTKSFWVLIILLILLFSINIVVFFFKSYLQEKLGISIPLFILYILILTLISTFASFYSVELILGASVIRFCHFGTILIMGTIKSVRDKKLIQTVVVFSLTLVSFIIYCLVVKVQIVGCFIYCSLLSMFCLYAIFSFGSVLEEFNNKNQASLMTYAISMMCCYVDALVSSFK